MYTNVYETSGIPLGPGGPREGNSLWDFPFGFRKPKKELIIIIINLSHVAIRIHAKWELQSLGMCTIGC